MVSRLRRLQHSLGLALESTLALRTPYTTALVVATSDPRRAGLAWQALVRSWGPVQARERLAQAVRSLPARQAEQTAKRYGMSPDWTERDLARRVPLTPWWD